MLFQPPNRALNDASPIPRRLREVLGELGGGAFGESVDRSQRRAGDMLHPLGGQMADQQSVGAHHPLEPHGRRAEPIVRPGMKFCDPRSWTRFAAHWTHKLETVRATRDKLKICVWAVRFLPSGHLKFPRLCTPKFPPPARARPPSDVESGFLPLIFNYLPITEDSQALSQILESQAHGGAPAGRV